jgi:hypothetical protein
MVHYFLLLSHQKRLGELLLMVRMMVLKLVAVDVVVNLWSYWMPQLLLLQLRRHEQHANLIVA